MQRKEEKKNRIHRDAVELFVAAPVLRRRLHYAAC